MGPTDLLRLHWNTMFKRSAIIFYKSTSRLISLHWNKNKAHHRTIIIKLKRSTDTIKLALTSNWLAPIIPYFNQASQSSPRSRLLRQKSDYFRLEWQKEEKKINKANNLMHNPTPNQKSKPTSTSRGTWEIGVIYFITKTTSRFAFISEGAPLSEHLHPSFLRSGPWWSPQSDPQFHGTAWVPTVGEWWRTDQNLRPAISTVFSIFSNKQNKTKTALLNILRS